MRSQRPRAAWHTVAGSVVAAYLLAAAVVVAAHPLVPVSQWLALHLLVLGATSNAVSGAGFSLRRCCMPGPVSRGPQCYGWRS